MSAGSHRGSRPDYISSSVLSPFMVPEDTSSSEWSQYVRPEDTSGSEWSQYVRPEFRRKVEIEWRMMRLRDLEMERRNMQSRDQLGSSLGHFNSIQQANISSLGKRNAQGDEVRIPNRPDLEQLRQLKLAELHAQNARDKLLEAAMRAHFKRQQELDAHFKRQQEEVDNHFKRQQEEVNGTTRDVDLTLRMWFQEEEECMNEPNKKQKNA